MTGKVTGIAMQLPKYVRQRKQSLFYQRDYPSSIIRRTGQKTYSRSLKLKANEHNDAELQKAIADAAEMYVLNVKILEHTDPSHLSDSELDKAAAEWIEKKGYRFGEFANDSQWQSLAMHIEPELDEPNDALQTEAVWFEGEAPEYTTRQEVMRRAYKALTSHNAQKTVLISDAWEKYVAVKNIDLTTKEGKIELMRHKRVLACIGDIPLTMPNSNTLMRQGINRYYLENKDKKKPQSIRREVSKTRAAINYTLRELAAGWTLENAFSEISDAPPKKKKVFSEGQRIQLALTALSETDRPHLAAMILLMMQTGAMASEIQRLNPKEVKEQLAGTTPVVIIGANSTKTKTEARKRVVPIVFGVDYLRYNIDKTISFLNQGKNPLTNSPHLLKRYISNVIDDSGFSAHCFRHTIQAQSVMKNINGRHTAAIGGWSGKDAGFSKHMLEYGAEYLSHDEGLLQVRDSCLKIHNEVLTAIGKMNASNVIKFTMNN